MSAPTYYVPIRSKLSKKVHLVLSDVPAPMFDSKFWYVCGMFVKGLEDWETVTRSYSEIEACRMCELIQNDQMKDDDA